MKNLIENTAIFDLETTGIDVNTDRIVQICVKIGDNITTRLINPECAIPHGATEVHGITNEMVKDEPTFKQIAKALNNMLKGKSLCGFNSNRFDVPMLVKEFERAGIEFDVSEVDLIDVSNIYRRLNPRDLSSAYLQYTGKELDGAHDAKNDVLATEELLIAMSEKHEELKDADLNLYSNYDKKRIDLSGLFLEDDDKNIIFGFGKHSGKVATTEKSYLDWVVTKSDFPKDTKNKAKELLNIK